MSWGINIENDVLNQKGSPAIYSDTLANRPAAGYAGRLFVSSDTFEIYRDNGNTWDLVGSGSVGNLQEVTDNGNITTNSINISYNGGPLTSGEAAFGATATYTPTTNQGGLDFYGLVGQFVLDLSSANFSGLDSFNRTGVLGATFITNNNGVKSTARFASVTAAATFDDVLLEDYALLYAKQPDVSGVNTIDQLNGLLIDDLSGFTNSYGINQLGAINNYFKARLTVFETGLKLDNVNNLYSFGDWINANSGTLFEIDDLNEIILTKRNVTNINGLKIDFGNNDYFFGDFANAFGLRLNVANTTYGIFDFANGYYYGLYINSNDGVTAIGDYEFAVNGTNLLIDDNNQRLQVSNNLIDNAAGAASGNYLTIWNNGNEYKIALLNP